jgi:DNA-binding IclR family transcriptional regulator
MTDVARTLELPLSTTHGLLRDLVRGGYVELDEDSRRYSTGHELIALSLRLATNLPIIEISRPLIAELARRIGEDVYLGLALPDGVCYVDRAEGNRGLRVTVNLGVPRPLHSTALGKLYLAMLPDSDRAARLTGMSLDAFTSYTETDKVALLSALGHIRQVGYSTNEEESIEGISALAAPILDANARFAGAICVSLPIGVFSQRRSELIPVVRATAFRTSRRLGWVGDEAAAILSPGP